MNRILGILLILFSSGTGYLFSQDVSLSVEAPNVVQVGEQFRLSYTVNARPSAFNPPQIADFYVLAGPNQSTSTSVQIVNGRRTSSYNITYTYYLQATGAGKFTLPAASVTVENKQYSSRSVEIEVVGSGAGGGGDQTGSGNTQQPEDVDLSQELFVRLHVDKKTIYRGEPIVATIKLYTRVQLTGFGENKMPDFAGFWTQEIEAPTQLNLVRENVAGKIYNSGMIRKVILFPQKSGEITIEPFTLEAYVRQQTRRQRSPFDDFFGSNYSNVLRNLQSPPVKITVKELPGGAPENFTGAVGKISLKAEIDKTEALTNDALTYKVSLSGSGNIQLLDNPKINFPPDFEAYDPKVQTNVKNSDAGQQGSKTFEYLLIPRHAGNFRIAPVSMAYFDPQAGQYKSISTEEFNLSISKSGEEETVGVIAGRTKEDLKIIGQDILFIKDESFRLHKIGKGFYGSLLFILLYASALFVFILVIIFRRKRMKRMQNLELVKNQRASKEARKRLKEASAFMKKNENEAFFESILKALEGYLVDKLNIPVSELSKDKAREGLTSLGIEEDQVTEYLELADICEMARYAPSSVEGQVESVYNRSVKIIGSIEQNLRK